MICGHCGKLEDAHFMKHSKNKHPGKLPTELGRGQDIEQYLWMDSKPSYKNEENLNVGAGDLPFLPCVNTRFIVELCKSQLKQKKLIPYHYKHYGFQAVKEMFISKERIPRKLEKPKEVDLDLYYAAYHPEDKPVSSPTKFMMELLDDMAPEYSTPKKSSKQSADKRSYRKSDIQLSDYHNSTASKYDSEIKLTGKQYAAYMQAYNNKKLCKDAKTSKISAKSSAKKPPVIRTLTFNK